MLLNDTKVFPSRFFGKKETGAKIEIMVIDNLGSERNWTALSRPYKRLKEGAVINFSENFNCEIIEKLGEGKQRAKAKRMLARVYDKQYGKEKVEAVIKYSFPFAKLRANLPPRPLLTV